MMIVQEKLIINHHSTAIKKWLETNQRRGPAAADDMARTIKAQGEKISEQDAKIQTLEAENAKLAERLAAIEAKLAK